ncbi:MAG: hypothetical protein JAY64_08610 [Candidatus Thiodiazotropha weberae]|nr:hypothetical protein [Candidatus Thiodiazotropha lotti]MCG8011749.1 hypothetical protein [Candidatus Thiodiazotropha lotti]MCW4211215.1 hypothetical protein [Candidatus Thiodiazotropha lotti]MCW4218086.1 hypothetical protein [Candidatus Thiodiazotropha lotti]
METQFFKHLETKILPLVKKGRNPGEFAFEGNKAPILDYHLAGSWFTPDRRNELIIRFNKIMMDDGRLNKIMKAEPKFEFGLDNIILGDLLPSIIN